MPTNVARIGANLAIGGFVPEIWSKRLNAIFYAQTYLMQICNSDWQGDISSNGSVVKIRQTPEVEITEHTVGAPITYQDMTDDFIELLINRSLKWAIQRESIDKAQQDIDIFVSATDNAARNMKIKMEKIILSAIYGDAGNVMTSVALDKTNVYDWIVDQGVLMDENNLPEQDRWLILPPKAAGLIAKSDLKNNYMTGDTNSVMRKNVTNENIGMIQGIHIYSSNNVSKTGATYNCISGQKSAVTFASQFTDVTKLVLESQFGEAVRGQNLFGFKTVKPSALNYAPVTIA